VKPVGKFTITLDAYEVGFLTALLHREIIVNTDPWALSQSKWLFLGSWATKTIRGLTLSVVHELAHWAGGRRHEARLGSNDWDDCLKNTLYPKMAGSEHKLTFEKESWRKCP